MQTYLDVHLTVKESIIHMDLISFFALESHLDFVSGLHFKPTFLRNLFFLQL